MESEIATTTKSKSPVCITYNVGRQDAHGHWKYSIPEKPSESLRFVCLSDTHNKHLRLQVPDGDVLIHAGDFTASGREIEIKKFAEFIKNLPHKHKIVIAGNHDVTFHPEYYLSRWESRWKRVHRNQPKFEELKQCVKDVCTYLEDSSTIIEGFKIYGSPWQPEFCDWAFNLKTKEELKSKWDQIPNDCDILVTHGPPSGNRGGNLYNNKDAGCTELLKALERVNPIVHVFGHIHEGYGVYKSGNTTCINASNLDLRYNAVNNPIVFDIIFQNNKE